MKFQAALPSRRNPFHYLIFQELCNLSEIDQLQFVKKLFFALIKGPQESDPPPRLLDGIRNSNNVRFSLRLNPLYGAASGSSWSDRVILNHDLDGKDSV
ncbi:hypothetical protein AVEN_58556-1 [Araneus ventricosus]|uniref:Uncharacterized protein n=1 Tax=Araneus ventricosus TaxID=182803 RepID=A0A4Y2Q2J2_ARAVE|nr:hypothetical protein AVEN_58556-1 [Araneus ventricosus]